MKKNSDYLKIFFILIVISQCVANCGKKTNSQTSNIGSIEFPDQEGWNAIVISTKDGILNAVIRYGHMQRFKKRKVVEFDNKIAIDFYDENGRHTSKLTSEKGKLNEATNDIEAIENVVVVSDSGINLRTEQIWWDNSIEKVVTDKFVTITTTQNDTFYGFGFESDQRLNNWSIRKISGKAGRGLDLGTEFKEKKTRPDSFSIDSLSIQPKTGTDALIGN